MIDNSRLSIEMRRIRMYDVAFSFAGEDRDIIEKIKEIVSNEYSVFYDNDNQSELVGKDLYRYLRNLYANNARYVACFLSEHYYKKIWTNLEFTAVRERFMNTFFDSDFLIPIMLDNSPLTRDIPSFIGYYKHTDISKTAELIKEKIRIPYADNSIIQHRENILKYFLEKVCEAMQAHRLKVSSFQNKLYIESEGVKTVFTFSNDEFLNLPCVLIFQGELNTNLCAEIIITWERCSKMEFSIMHSFDYTSDDDRKYSAQDVVKVVTDDLIRLSEV